MRPPVPSTCSVSCSRATRGWSSSRGSRARLRDQRGLHHLRTLLERPGIEVPALTLAGSDQGLAGSSEGTVLDDRAIREYRRRIADLHEDIDEATANNDFERAARAEAELDVLVDAADRGHRRRRTRHDSSTAPTSEPRVSVTKAIRSAISHLGEQLPSWDDTSRATVHTGQPLRLPARPPRRRAFW